MVNSKRGRASIRQLKASNLKPECMKISKTSDGGLPSGGLDPANDEPRRLANSCPVTGLHHEGHHPAASIKKGCLSSTATPHPGGFKCFTCQEAADNYECNRWAPDVYCPKDTRYCYTLHMMDNHGDSVSVTKRCATLDDCLFTGCAGVTDNGYVKVRVMVCGVSKPGAHLRTSSQHLNVTGQVCSSCCEGNICNMLVPWNESSAVFTSTSPLVSSSWRLHPAVMSNIIISIILSNS
ncbi:hypothetical protein INR49_026111 [Caranx melampygus]|nr:hypothetical protein INR49_026111 [Caranx melampygus]